MKKHLNQKICTAAILALAITFTLIACGKQETVSIGGTYHFGESGPSGSVQVYPLTDSTALFHLELSLGAPSYNSGEATGQMAIKDGVGTYSQKDDFGDCILKFKFAPRYVDITTEPGHEECGFGFNVSASNKYEQVNKSIPEYFINMQGDTTFFKNLAAKPAAVAQSAPAKPDTLYITETGYVSIWIMPDDYVDETGDGSFYMGNALGKVEELGLKGVSAGKDSYVSFALAKGKQHIIKVSDYSYDIFLYKKGQKPITLDLGSERPITGEVYKYLGINLLEYTIVQIVKAIQDKHEGHLNEFIQDGVTLMHYPVGMYPAYDKFDIIVLDRQMPNALTLDSDIDIADYKVRFEELPSFDCDEEKWKKHGIYASAEDKGKDYQHVNVVDKKERSFQFILNLRDGEWRLGTIIRPDFCGA